MSALPAPRTGIHDRVQPADCYADRDMSASIAVEAVSDWLERCWWGSGPRDFYARWTPAYHRAQAAAYASHAIAVPCKPTPIGSRFD